MALGMPPCANCGADYSRGHGWHPKKKGELGRCRNPKPGTTTFYRQPSVPAQSGKGAA
jgi:hypothetical protein